LAMLDNKLAPLTPDLAFSFLGQDKCISKVSKSVFN
jgi:hypothetical protein